MTVAVRVIALLGARAVGKTTLGRALAARLQWAFVDTDEALAARVGQGAGAYLTERGEAAFRAVERAVVLDALATAERTVMALGGGAVTIPEVRQALRVPGVLPILLLAPASVLAARQAQAPRPPLTGLPLVAEIATLIEQRRAAHAEVAPLTLETSGSSVEACCASLLARVLPTLDPGRGSGT